uniref:Putative secreted protein n=1 Tax=Ixodes ricinus TaxID=34613 RepID=A0A147BBJ3_IXORI
MQRVPGCLWPFPDRHRSLWWVLLCRLAFTAVLYRPLHLAFKPRPPDVAPCTLLRCHHAPVAYVYKR